MTENGANGYITIESNGVVVHQDDTGSITDEMHGKDQLYRQLFANSKLIEQAPTLFDALLALTNYFEVHTADTGRTSRGEEVFQNARKTLLAAININS
jgi:hypothetical protein